MCFTRKLVRTTQSCRDNLTEIGQLATEWRSLMRVLKPNHAAALDITPSS